MTTKLHNYQSALDYLYSQLPMYQKIGKQAYKPGLDRIKALLHFLGNPERDFKSVHVAGTNGKGTTCHLMASVLQKQGCKTGLYTSPHLVNFTERVKVNGKEIPESRVLEFVNLILPKIKKLNPSFFEISVALSFWHFSLQEVELAIIETGLGGRLDSTNVLSPILTIITNISHDHNEILGDTLEKIATEKAGIIKQNCPVIIGRKQKETSFVFKKTAQKMNSSISYANDYPKHIVNTLISSTLKENTQTAFAGLSTLKKLGFTIHDKAIKEGFLNYKKLSGLKGRFDYLKGTPSFLLDTAHNENGIKLLMSQIKSLTYEHLHIVLGMVSDKDHSNILQLLPNSATYYFCKPDVPRGLDSKILSEKAAYHQLMGKHYSSIHHAITSAHKQAKEKDLIFIGGSTFVVGEAYAKTMDHITDTFTELS